MFYLMKPVLGNFVVDENLQARFFFLFFFFNLH